MYEIEQPFFHPIAAIYGQTEIFKMAMDMVEDIHPQNNNGDTPLHNAAIHNRMKIVETIVANTYEKNPKNKYRQVHLLVKYLTNRW